MYKETVNRILSSIIIIPIALFFIIKGSFFFTFFLAICFLISSLEWYKMSQKKSYLIPGFLFLVISFYFTYLLRNAEKDSLTIFFVVITICIATDIGGYVFGKIFKGPKLTKISPNKTYSGMLGGYFFSIIFFNILINSTQFLKSINIQIHYKIDFTPSILTFILLISTVSQIGDLIISYFKRISKIKNTGKIIPGHGGLLDRIDGMIFALPFCYLLTLVFQ